MNPPVSSSVDGPCSSFSSQSSSTTLSSTAPCWSASNSGLNLTLQSETRSQRILSSASSTKPKTTQPASASSKKPSRSEASTVPNVDLSALIQKATDSLDAR
jgi:hypothetical protein